MRLAARVGAEVMAMVLLALGAVGSGAAAGAPQDGRGEPSKKGGPPQAKVKLGLSVNDPRASRGYVLLNPMNHKTTYLIDPEGRVVKTWESAHQSMHAADLLEDGHLFRVAALSGQVQSFGAAAGAAGRIQEFD
jgi:hypothetical protein